MKPIGKYYLKVLEAAEAANAKKMDGVSPGNGDEFDQLQVIADALKHLRTDIQQRVATPWADYGHDDCETGIDDIADNYVDVKQLHSFLTQATKVTWGNTPDAPVLAGWSVGAVPLVDKPKPMEVLFLKFRDAAGGMLEYHIDVAAGITASGKDNRIVVSAGVIPDVVLILHFFKQEPLPLREMPLFPLKPSDVIRSKPSGGIDR